MSWLDDLLQRRSTQERERDHLLEKQLQETQDAYKKVDRMVGRLLKDLGRAFWANRSGWSWRVNHYQPRSALSTPCWKIEASRFMDYDCGFTVTLVRNGESKGWSFAVKTSRTTHYTLDLTEEALQTALREAFKEGPHSRESR